MDVPKLKGSFDHDLSDCGIGIVTSSWNRFITDKLYEGALNALEKHGVEESQVLAVQCPGSYEIPLAAQELLEKERIDGVIAIGAVIRGETPHFDYVCSAVNNGIAELNRSYGKPVSFGILTTDTVQQALERSGIKSGNKGAEAALALLEMISLVEKIRQQ